jgi:hypothetical protein
MNEQWLVVGDTNARRDIEIEEGFNISRIRLVQNARAGAVRVYDPRTGDLVHTLIPEPARGDKPNRSAYTQFGASVALNGNLLVVGAPGEVSADVNGLQVTALPGAAYIFDLSSGQ